MRLRLPRLLRLGLPFAAVLALGLGGCGDPSTPAPATPPSSPASPGPTSGGALARAAGTTGTTGSDGLTVRYLAGDGTVKTVGVEDFPR